jgi:hypothetical protein
MMRTRPLQLTLGREEGFLHTEEVHQGEGILLIGKHLQSCYGRRILVRSNVLSVVILGTMLHSFHTRGEEEEGNRNQQQRLMRLQTGSIGISFWSSPFQVLSLTGRDGWWITKHLVI